MMPGPFAITGLWRVFRLLDARLRARTALVFCLMLAQSLLELGFILTLAWLGMALTDTENLRETALYRHLFQFSPELRSWAEDAYHLLMLSGIVVVITCLIKNVVNYFCASRTAMLGEDIAITVGNEILHRFMHMDYAWHLSNASEKTFQIMMWRDSLSTILTHLLSIYACVCSIVILFASLVGQEPVLTLLVLGSTGLIGVFLYALIRKAIDRNALSAARSATELNRVFLCTTRGIRDVLLYHQQRAFQSKLVQAAHLGRWPRIFGNIAPSLPTWILEFTGFALVVAAIAFLVYVQHADVQRITLALAMLLLTAWRVLPFANRIVSLQISVRSLLPMAMGVIDLLEKFRAEPLTTPVEANPNFSFTSDITLKDVSFHYPDVQHNALRHISLTVCKGEKIGLIGPSGAGKSTLAAIFGCLLSPTEGVVLVDGTPLTPERAVALKMRTGYVPQNPFLFAGSLAENIAFGSYGQPVDRARLEMVCRQAAIDFAGGVAGYDLPIGENGAGLSGGQAQRVSIARALYIQPRLVIFDEATSSLDQANENIIQRTLESLGKGVTCIIIAHRLETVEHCDRLIWLENGEIVMQGTPDDVLQMYKRKK